MGADEGVLELELFEDAVFGLGAGGGGVTERAAFVGVAAEIGVGEQGGDAVAEAVGDAGAEEELFRALAEIFATELAFEVDAQGGGERVVAEVHIPGAAFGAGGGLGVLGLGEGGDEGCEGKEEVDQVTTYARSNPAGWPWDHAGWMLRV